MESSNRLVANVHLACFLGFIFIVGLGCMDTHSFFLPNPLYRHLYFICLSLSLFFFFFWQNPRHAEVPWPGKDPLEPQQRHPQVLNLLCHLGTPLSIGHLGFFQFWAHDEWCCYDLVQVWVFLFVFLSAAPAAYGSSQARGQIWATAVAIPPDP